ncbi:MAG: ATP-dependent metallopeptidase FtsH/Yme1/Tma family protein, partial [Planctomycetaceae bacterium]
MSDSSGKPSPPTPPPSPKPTGSSGGEPRRFSFSSMTLLLLVLAAVISVLAWSSSPTNHGTTVPYSFFREQLAAGLVKSVTFHGEVLTGRWSQTPTEAPPELTGKLMPQFNTVLPPDSAADSALMQELLKQKVNVVSNQVPPVGLGDLFIWVFLPVIFLFFMWSMLRRSADPFGAGGMMGGFIRSPARRFEKSEKSATFDDVAGLRMNPPIIPPAPNGSAERRSIDHMKNRKITGR